MKDQVIMSPNNGQLVIGVPLFRLDYSENLGQMEGYNITLTNSKPLAYAIDCGEDVGIQLMSAEWAEKHLEFLGDL